MTRADSVSYYEQDALWGEHIGASARDVRDTVLAMIPADARSILDAGCGNGAITNHLPADRHIEGCDISKAALAHVRCPTKIADLTNLPFGDGEFDLVLATDVLEHIPDTSYARALSELFRVSSRWILVAVPYNEILDAATVECRSCKASFHVHLHQRSYSAQELAKSWEGQAGVVEHAFCGARWRWSSPLVVELLHLANGRYYGFEHAQCPQCGAAYHPEQSELAASIERRLESLHYALAISGRIAWPNRSEVVMLFDKTIDSKSQPPAEEDRDPPGALPSRVSRSDLAIVNDPKNYARATYLVPDIANTSAMFLPRLPSRIRVMPNASLTLHDPNLQRDVPLEASSEGWCAVPSVAASRFGYLLRIAELTEPWGSMTFDGEMAPWLSEALNGPRHEDLERRIEELLKLSEALEEKRAAGESRIQMLLGLTSELEASRDQVEGRVQELLKVTEDLENRRAAGEARIQGLLELCADVEGRRSQAELRVQELSRTIEALQRRLATGEERIEGLLALSAEIETKRDEAEVRIKLLLDLAEKLEAKRDHAERRVQLLMQQAEELETRRATAEQKMLQLTAEGSNKTDKK
ncbi:class I SAM-dependent methyltransferase [Bradyrhizobium sp. CCBAU 45394]|uniref:class I SAM-dependent methyltransferase n=1 Tax=Bradyrhizobium sp. CCBAU 45394 TaxID=1325087 RepID=UPI0023027633|nr:methyltransferase domain-containing protein [Bradyrhizobium sp. CCBAU 45394]